MEGETGLRRKNRMGKSRAVALLQNRRLWYLAAALTACSVFYYADSILDALGLPNPHWAIFYTIHDLHRLLFVVPVLYAAYKFRVRGVIATVSISALVFLPRALLTSPYPEPLLRARSPG